MQRAKQRNNGNPIGAAAAEMYANPGFQHANRGPQYLPPDPDQPGRYAAAKRQVHEYAVPGDSTTPALDNYGYVVDGYNPHELGRRANLILHDENGYVVDDFDPDQFGRRATINVGAKKVTGGATTIYAIPVADDERVASVTDGKNSHPLRSSKAQNRSVYAGFGASAHAQGSAAEGGEEEEEEC